MSDWNGEGYAQVSGLQRTLAEKSLSGLALGGGERLLDVGCGDGFVTARLAARLPRGSVVGVDASPSMIDTARSRPRPDGAPIEFLVADARDLPFRDEFDVVVSFNALHWVTEQHRALAGIARALRDGGRVIVQMVCASERPSLESVITRACRRPEWSGDFAGFEPPFLHVDPADYRDLATSAGLAVTDLRVGDLDWDFGSREAFARWCAVGSTAWTSRLDERRATDFVDQVVRDYETVAGRPGLFRFTQMRAELAKSSTQ
ncbi:methyltransferase domain-containing protein [Rhodococcus spelaei]|uniref:Methyltransferase domain-containing protein n=1 Tax=Rhodococcus spelaei TaxID=2546320 RepID=A0A541B0W9_9NOCA|nr:class I SAM-dependent methyltransferase [Rhodococcus spelaei]TQF65964.1 methyltransferase domain-containing protein [Rhodococcus spelaei]